MLLWQGITLFSITSSFSMPIFSFSTRAPFLLTIKFVRQGGPCCSRPEFYSTTVSCHGVEVTQAGCALPPTCQIDRLGPRTSCVGPCSSPGPCAICRSAPALLTLLSRQPIVGVQLRADASVLPPDPRLPPLCSGRVAISMPLLPLLCFVCRPRIPMLARVQTSRRVTLPPLTFFRFYVQPFAIRRFKIVGMGALRSPYPMQHGVAVLESLHSHLCNTAPIFTERWRIPLILTTCS